TGAGPDRSGEDPAVGDDELVAAAVDAADRAKSTWTRYDLAREVTRRIHLEPGAVEAGLARVDRLVEAVTAEGNRFGVVSLAPPAVFTTPATLHRRADGDSVYEEHGAVRYSTNPALDIERRLLERADDTTGPRSPVELVEAVIAADGLDADQAGATRAVLTSGRRLEPLVGPAGTGKTTTMGAVARAWAAGSGQVLGVSIAENASRILADRAGIRTINAAKLLYEHTHRTPVEQAELGWQRSYGISPGSLVILDEAGMASRQVIDGLSRICDNLAAKLLLVGDPEQLDSPQAGGTFELIAQRAGAVQLSDVHRFRQAWERTASLRLRAGDPKVLDEYDRRGRIVGGSEAGMEDAAYTAAVADRARGLRVYLLADTNETAARLAGRIRHHLVGTGQVDDSCTV
ncbi:MAG: AAA family ATPase, partial [Actinomycetes bacterium]